MAQTQSLGYAVPFFVVSFFILYFFFSGLQYELSNDVPSIPAKGPGQSLLCLIIQISCSEGSILLCSCHTGYPDFAQYRHIGTLSDEQLSLGY